MTRLGFVIYPDGRRVYTEDRQTYFEQHPECIETTRYWQENHERQRKKWAVFNEEQDKLNQTPAYQHRDPWTAEASEDLPGKERKWVKDGEEGFEHYGCVGGKVPKGCGECLERFKRLENGVTCEKCLGTKLLWEDCEKCPKEPQLPAANEAADATNASQPKQASNKPT